MTHCRVCQFPLYDTPLLVQKNMPSAAQHLPDKTMLKEDRGVDLKLMQCSGCGLVQLDNRPVSYYKEVIRAAGFSPEMRAFRSTQFKEFVEKYHLKNKKVLEIGCGAGEYLEIMQDANTNAIGIEYGEESVAACHKKGLSVQKRYLDSSADLDGEPFDAFFIMSYLEHIPDPNLLFESLLPKLSDDAIGLVEVPNVDMIIDNSLFSEFIGDHLFYFTKETLKSTLNRFGFDVLDMKIVWHNYIISAEIKKRSPLDLSSFEAIQDNLTQEINDYIDQFGDNRVAIWGAGHQALAIMSLTNLKGKIKYVVDSAPFKQSKYTPATQIPIVAPDRLKTDPVDAIIVMAASYSDEVVRIIKANYGKICHIAILKESNLEQVLGES
jgi:2-polyprenyl-3-methyl-5-hydroxy-6-metoxy-1,4-benzoquinol methylase